jgi:DNA adenine methylase
MELKDYQDLAGILATVKAKFILSINDLPEMRDAFGEFKVSPVSLKYSVSKGDWSIGKELLISNF